MKIEYVLIFAHGLPAAFSQTLILIERTKDDWQKGRLNLPGGKVHMGYESVEQAAFRELREETGITAKAGDIQILGQIEGDNWLGHVCWVPFIGNYGRNEPRTCASDEGTILKMNYRDALEDPRLLPELRVILPLCIARISGWHVWAGNPDTRQTPPQFLVTV